MVLILALGIVIVPLLTWGLILDYRIRQWEKEDEREKEQEKTA